MFNVVKYFWKPLSIPRILYLGLNRTSLEYAILLNHPDISVEAFITIL
jgi:hypothetical protein